MSTFQPAAPLRIAHLIETDGPGGAERVVAQLAASLQAAGAENVVFLPASGEGWLAGQLEGTGVAIEHFRIDRPLSPQCARFLVDAFERRRVDVAHSHEFSMAVYGAWAAWRAGVPHVITMHGSRYYAQRLQRRLAMRAAVGLSGRTVAVSSPLGAALARDLRLRPSRVRLVANGVPHASSPDVTLRRELGLGAGGRLLLAIGNLYPVKGHAYLIDAVARLAGPHPGLHLAIAGRGGLEGHLRAQAAQQGIADRVHLLGLRADVAALLAASDVFVLPSLSEGLPMALLEAMCAARPIVATAVGDVGRVLGGGSAGLLVPPGDAGGLAVALDSLLRDGDRARALGAAAFERAQRHYTLDRMVGRYLRTYRALLRLGRSSPVHERPARSGRYVPASP